MSCIAGTFEGTLAFSGVYSALNAEIKTSMTGNGQEISMDYSLVITGLVAQGFDRFLDISRIRFVSLWILSKHYPQDIQVPYSLSSANATMTYKWNFYSTHPQ